MPKRKYDAKRFYEIAVAADGKRTVAEMANEVGAKVPAFVTQIAQYAHGEGLPVPSLPFKIKPTAIVKAISREDVNANNFIRVSALRLTDGGLGDVRQFNLICDAGYAHGLVLVAPRELEASNFKEAVAKLLSREQLEELLALTEAKPRGGDIHPLRVPRPHASSQGREIG